MAAWNVDNGKELCGLFANFFQGHGVIGMANLDLSPINIRVIVHTCWEWIINMRPELFPQKRMLLAFLQVKKTKRFKTKIIYFDLFFFYSMWVFYRNARSALVSRAWNLLYARDLKASGERCTALAVFVHLKTASNRKCSKDVWRLQRGLNNFLSKLNQVNSIEKDKKQQELQLMSPLWSSWVLLSSPIWVAWEITSGSLLLHMRQYNTWPHVALSGCVFPRGNIQSRVYISRTCFVITASLPRKYSEHFFRKLYIYLIHKISLPWFEKTNNETIEIVVFIHEVSNTVCTL